MTILVSLLIAASAAVTMYRIVSRHNQELLRTLPVEDALARNVDPWLAAAGTAVLAIVVAPIVFYKMHGPVGLLYGAGFVAAMMTCSVMTHAAVAYAMAV